MVGPRPKRQDYMVPGIGGKKIFRQGAFNDAVADWQRRRNEERSDSARAHGRYPGSTRHVGAPHSSEHNPEFHADKEITDLDGVRSKEHSADPADIEFGRRVQDAVRERRRKG